MNTVVILLVWFVLFGAIGYLIGQRKGRPTAGLLWAMALGPIGWLLVWLGPTVDPEQAQRDSKPTRKIRTMGLPRQ